MAATIRCPECNERFTPSSRSSKLRCPECRYVFPRDDDEDERPRSSSRRRDDDDEERDESTFPVVPVVVGGVLALLLVAGGLYFVLRPAKKEPAAAVAVQDVGDEQRALPPQVKEPIAERRPAPKAKDRVIIVPPIVAPPVVVNPPAERPKIQKPPTPEVDPEQAATNVAWSAAPDPATEKFELPAKSEKIVVPLGIGGAVHFPTSPSPFFAVGASTQKTDAITLFDLRSKKPAGFIRGKTDLRTPMALSPDGKYLAGQAQFKPIVDVFDFVTGQGIRRLEWKTGQIKWLDFGAESATLIVCVSDFTNTSLQIWNIASGEMTGSIPLPKHLFNALAIAMSPGRHQIAIALKERVHVYRLTDGKLLGTTPFPDFNREEKVLGESKCEGLAFSPDGAEIAGLFTHYGNRRAYLSAWAMADGKIRFEHELSDSLDHTSFTISGGGFEYAPDGNAWLIQNNLLVERESGIPLTKLRGERNAGREQLRLFPNDLMVAEDSSARAVVGIPFNRTAYETALKAARGKAAAIVAPVEADRSAVKIVPAELTPQWEVKEDGGPLKPKLYPSIALASPGPSIRAALFGNPESGRFATVSIIDKTTPFIHKSLRWDNFSLATGKHLPAIDLGIAKEAAQRKGKLGRPVAAAGVVAGLSPSGKRLAIRALADPKRIDVWSDDGKVLVAFLPSLNGEVVDAIDFTDEDKLLTLAGGKLALWELPTCKAIYETATSYRGVPSFSPGKRWLALFQSNGFDILDTATGETHGLLPTGVASSETELPVAAFSADGKKIAAVVPTPFKTNVFVCDVEKGVTAEAFEISAPTGRLQWCGPSHLLYGSQLIDLDLKLPLWNYTGAALTAGGALDGRFWYVRTGTTPAGPGILASTVLPDPVAAQASATIRLPTTQMILGPQTAISLQINAAGPSGDPELIKTATKQLTGYLEQRGFVVRDGAPLTLAIGATVQDTGEIEEVKPLSGGKGGKTTFPLKKVVVDLKLNDAAGRNIWKDQQTVKQSGALRFFNGAEDVEKTMELEMWRSASATMMSPRIPARAYVAEGNLFVPPGNSILGR